MATPQPDLLAVAERSPRAAAAHDRARWVGLFTIDGRIEDPVGSRPHVGLAQIGRFFDTFIDPRDITFHRDLDIVRDTAVLRDLELEVAMGSAVTMHIPAFLRYDLREVDGDWKFARLRAYWELPAMMWAFLRNGRAALPAGGQLAGALLRNQRLAGTAGFTAGFRRPGAKAKDRVHAFVDALSRGDTSTARGLLSPGAAVTHGDTDPTDLGGLAQQLEGARSTKILAAGSTVTLSARSERHRGVLFADIARGGTAIRRIRYFPG